MRKLVDDISKTVRERVKTLKAFYVNLVSFLAINFVLLIINLATSPGNLWFYWVTIFWGIGLLVHGVNTFSLRGKYLGKEWEEQKTREIMERQEEKEERKAG